MLINILENAAYHAKGKTELRFTVALEGDKACFTVSDNGCGIDERILPQLFRARPGAENYIVNELGVGYRMNDTSA